MDTIGHSGERRRGARVLGAFIDALDWDEVLDLIQRWARTHTSRSVCCCNAHSLVTMRQSSEVDAAIGSADLSVPDGMPVAWMLRKLGFASQPRLNGPDLMWRYCRLAEREGTTIFLYGNRDSVLEILRARLQGAFPRLRVAGMIAPPYRPLTEAEDEEVVARINDSGAGVVFVSLGCPKQEMWMAQHRTRIHAVQIGVGAAFDYHAGTLKRAPLWMQRHGLEWLHRLCTEPRRLWRRYFYTNALFVLGAGKQLFGRRPAV
ncbi:MAG TPA: WecB/TagA/CpsF family glycosyltransferase [Burkholderiales bacterium]|jgi:N-acetylglucosaminyldiphosphoundecaprenol N-acetyl-beta-D-mannosaminyltransferase